MSFLVGVVCMFKRRITLSVSFVGCKENTVKISVNARMIYVNTVFFLSDGPNDT
jgi:hypothetical protein